MKGMLRLTILEVAIALILLRVIYEPLQTTAQVANDPIASTLMAYDPSPTTGSPSQGIRLGSIRYIPPETNPPSGGNVGTIRGNCIANAGKPGVRALVPERAVLDSLGKPTLDDSGNPVKVAWGQTLSEHPTLWFDVPYTNDDDLPVKFVLQDSDGNDLYRTSITLPKTPSIIGIQVPAAKPALQPQKWYLWTLQVKCKGTTTNEKNDVVQGWIQRTTLDPAQFKEADIRKQAALYAKSGIWFDALTTLGNALTTKPENANLLRQDWKMLLESAGLQETTARPIVKQ